MGQKENLMTDSLPLLLILGLTCTARLFSEQIPALWQFGPVTVTDHRRADRREIAKQILSTAPPRLALAGLSMGGYIAFEIIRQAPECVVSWRCLIRAPVRTLGSKLNAVACS
jgi:pimeloyl-ACP methyl ester carboxylesterase